MKYKKGDEVRVIASKERLDERSIFVDITGQTGIIRDVGSTYYGVDIGSSYWFLEDQDLELAYRAVPVPVPAEQPIRTFDSGATRDTAQGKLDYVKALSPIVLRRYVQYLNRHRLQPDGSYRDFDNWKSGMPQDVYHSSGGRHFFEAWLLTEGYETEDNHGPVELEDVLCAQMFNIMGRLHELLKVKQSVDRTKPVPGGY